MKQFTTIVLLIMCCFVQQSKGQVYKEDFGSSATVNLPYVSGTNATGGVILNAHFSTPSWNQNIGSASFAGNSGGCMSATAGTGTYSITCTFTVASGFQLNPTNITLDNRGSSTGPTTLVVLIAGTGGNTQTGVSITRSGSFTAGESGNFVNQGLNLTGNITLTFNFTGGTGGSGTERLDNVILNGTVTTSCIPPTISATGTPGNGVICTGGSATLTANCTANCTGITYTWSPAIGLSATTGANVTANPTTTTVYTVTGATSSSCKSTATYTVTVGAPPVAAISGASAICSGSSSNLTAVVTSGGSTPFTYLWSTTDTTSSISISPTTNTIYGVTITDACSATSTASATVTVGNTIPALTAGASASTICAGSSSILTVAGATTYAWAPSTGLSSTSGATVTANPTTTTTYTITGTTIGCSSTDTITINVNPKPTVTAGASQSAICNGSSSSFTASGAVNYAWLPATGLDATSGDSVNANPSTTTNYTITGTDANSCTNTATLTLTINPLPTVSVSPVNGAVCGAGNSLVLTATGVNNGSVGTTLPTGYCTTGLYTTGCASDYITNVSFAAINRNSLCDGGTSGYSIYNSPNPVLIPGNTYSLTIKTSSSFQEGAAAWIDYNRNGLFTDAGETVLSPQYSGVYGAIYTVSVTIPSNASPGLTLLRCRCVGNGSPTGPCTSSTYGEVEDYYITIGFATFTWSPSLGLNSTTGAFITASITSATTYTVTGIDNNGCTSTAIATLTVDSGPAISAGASTSAICMGASATLTVSGANTYLWMPGGATTASLSVSPSSSTTYTVIGKDLNGCTNSNTLALTVNTSPTPSIISGNLPLCNGDPTMLSTGNYSSYAWSSNVATTQSIIALSGGTYSVTVTDANSYAGSTSYLLTQPSAISASSVLNSPILCQGNSTTITISASGGTPSYSNTGTFTVTAGTYTYNVADANDCLGSVSITVTEPSVLTASATSNSSVCKDSSLSLTSLGSGGTPPYNSYSWLGPNGFSSTAANPSFNASSLAFSGTYSVTISDANGCQATTTTTTTVNYCAITLNLKFFIEGYYLGSGQMNPAMFMEGVSGATINITDTVLVELHKDTSSYPLVESVHALLMTDGSATATFSGAVYGNSYWIAVRHRNSVQTWSQSSVAFGAVIGYDFTDARTKAYGSNQVLIDTGPNLWAFYNGDINQDGNIDLIDFPPLDFGINNGLFGYYATDLNGDGNVDLLDFPVLDANINNGIFAQRP